MRQFEITLSSNDAAFVDACIDRDMYLSASDVVRHALELLSEHQETRSRQVLRLREALLEAATDSRRYTLDEVRERLAHHHTPREQEAGP